jgi:teichuronic acid biosynthesis glycosyltransferase TuaH
MTDMGREVSKWESVYASSGLPPEGAEMHSIYLELADYARRILKDQPSPKSFEAGCGSGLHSLALARAGFDVELLDFSVNALSNVRALFQRAGLSAKVHQGDVFGEDALKDYDLVFNSGVLEHYSFPDQVRFVQAMARRSRKFTLVLVPNRNCYWYWIWRVQQQAMSNWPWGYEKPALDYTSVFLEAGLRLVEISYFGKAWTDAFIASLDLPTELRTIVQEVHKAGIVDVSLCSYLVGFLGVKDDMSKSFAPAIAVNRPSAADDCDRLDRALAHAADALSQMIAARTDHASRIAERDAQIRGLKNTLSDRDRQIDILTHAVTDRDEQVVLLNQKVTLFEESLSWRSTKRLRDASRLATSLRKRVADAILRISKHQVYKDKPSPKKRQRHYQKQLNTILKDNKGRPVIIFCPVVDWKVPLFQRPQHMAKRLADSGYLFFYCTMNHFDSVDGFEQVHERCYLTNQFELVDQLPLRKIIHIYAADPKCTWEYIQKHRSAGDLVLYEYIDEIHSDIAGKEVAETLVDRHIKVLKTEDIMCVTSAEKLYRDVARLRTRNLALVTNGVDIEHFSVSRDRGNVPIELKDIVEKNRTIVGYFGALAKWFDYELVMKLAASHPEYEIVLIGWNYDRSLDEYPISDYPNICVIGPIDYKVLPNYACWFDVCTIPFRVNDVTESTSPIKLFEYMALGHPIVTTDMPECRKYRSVLIGKDHEDFISRVEEALQKRKDDHYLSILKSEATENTWQSKARMIVDLIRDNMFKNPLWIRSIPAEDKLLDEVQSDIVSCHRSEKPKLEGYYERIYSKEERLYWFPVLHWIRSLSSVKRVADIGAAYGTLLLYAIKCHHPDDSLAIDAIGLMSPVLVARYNITYLNRDIERSTLEGVGKYDLLIFTETLEHLNFDPVQTLSKLREMLSPNGHIILTTPDAVEWGRVTTYYPRLDAIPQYTGQASEWIDGHVWQYTRKEVEIVIRAAGLEVENFAYAPGVTARHLCFLLRPRSSFEK